jgi:hypothetical protein
MSAAAQTLARLWSREAATSSTAARLALGLALFVVLTAVWLWPIAAHPGSRALSDFGDATQTMRDYWSFEAEGSTPFTSTHDDLNGAPEGRPRAPASTWLSPIQSLVVWPLDDLVGVVAAVNLFAVLGVVLTSWVMFAILLRAGFGFVPAALAGYLAACSPWMIEKAYAGHIAFLHGWVLVLLFAALARLLRERTLPAAALAGAAYGLCFLMAAYFGLLATALVLAFVIVDLVRARGWAERLWTFSLATVLGAVTAVALAPGLIAYVVDRERTTAVLGRSPDWLQKGGASLSSYLLPSPRHPLLGSFGVGNRPEDGLNEKVLFVGWTTIGLAVLAVAFLVLRRFRTATSPERHGLLTLAAVTVPVAFLFSLPSSVDVLGLELPTPAALVGDVTTFFRVYARFGYLVGLGLAVLAAGALARLRHTRLGLLGVGVLAALVVLEIVPGRAPAVPVDAAPAYDVWLHDQPRGIVAHYPAVTDKYASRRLASQEIYFQRFAHQPLFTGVWSLAGTREEAIRTLARHLRRPDTPGILAAEGVRYVVVHDDVFRSQGERPPLLRRGYRPLRRFGSVRVYAVSAEPVSLDAVLERRAVELAGLWGIPTPTLELTSAGFHAEESYEPSTDPWRWLIQGGRVLLHNPAEVSVRTRLRFKAFGNRRERELVLRDADGRPLASVTVPPFERNLTLGPFRAAPGTSALTLTTSPPPEPLSDAEDDPDRRLASVYISRIRVEALADYPPVSG